MIQDNKIVIQSKLNQIQSNILETRIIIKYINLSNLNQPIFLNMDIEYGESIIQKQLFSYAFKQQNCQFSHQKEKLKEMLDYLNNMKPCFENQTHMIKQLNLISELIKFFRSPILICFQNYYKILINDGEKYLEKYQAKIKQIAGYVKGTIDQRDFEQLNFFYFLGVSKRIKFNIEIPQEKAFLQYIHKLSQLLIQLKKNIQKKISSNKKISNIINKQMNDIYQNNLDRDLNFLEENYQNYLKRKAQSLINQFMNMLDKEQSPFVLQQTKQRQKPTNNLSPKSKIPLCCRTFFYKNEAIEQAEGYRLQYKNYIFPYKNQLINILKKTFCGFLNAQGGIIFIGIAQNNQNKKRIVNGSVYNQNTKEEVIKVFRKIAESIEPDIITHKLYNISFVPIKNSKPPHQYISGCFLIKITIRYGVRDDIYSYKNDEGYEYYSFRTENQVIHRQGREVLNALKQRVRNPLPIPEPLHIGACQPPQIGKINNSNDQYMKKQQIKQSQQRQEIYGQNKKNGYKIKVNGNQVYNYLGIEINQEQLKGVLRKSDLNLDYIKTIKKSNATFIQIYGKQIYEKFKAKISQIDNKNNIKFFKVSKSMRLQNQNNTTLEIANDAISSTKVKFKNSNKYSFSFENFEESSNIFLMLRQLGVPSDFLEQ